MDLDEASKLFEKVSDLLDEMEEAARLLFFLLFLEFAEKLKPFADKYDPDQPKRFLFRRLD